MTQRVFISHSHQDEAHYSSLKLVLDGAGVSRWDVSRLAPGSALAEGLREAIEQCDVCVFVATTRSLESRWCLAELGAFWGAGKRVIIYLADPDVHDGDLPPQFQGNVWTADASQLVRAIQEAEGGRVAATATGYSARLGRATIEVTLGRIEETSNCESDCLIALPANEFFDDECIHDSKSALGAFVQRHFPDRVAEFTTLLRNALAKKPTEEVEKRPEEMAPSYGIGGCAFLDRPLGSPYRIAMVAVTMQRANLGLHTDPICLFKAMATLQQIAANNRLVKLVVPLLGSGHGGLTAEVSLLCMLIALGKVQRGGGRNFREVEIVVFRSAPSAQPSISERRIVKALDFASRFAAH